MALIWPPNYSGELRRRMSIWRAGDQSEAFRIAAKTFYASDPVAFVADCVFVYEPRNASSGDPTKIPAVPFQRQAEFLEWLKVRFETKTSAPVEKSRDSGATWMASAFAVWVWLFHPGTVVGFGSRKEVLVDRLGDPSAIFSKIRAVIEHLPPWLLPEGWSAKDHSHYMRIINPENASVIIGEAGDNIGRGGRSTIYVIDEAAYIERPQMIEASLTANTDCRIDISSPRVGTIFNTWCATNPHKFIFDISDFPLHTPEWIAQKRADLESKGLGHIFRQEYLRDATAGIEGQLIPSDWIEAAIGAAEKIGFTPSGEKVAALDVADGGTDRNSLAMRHGVALFWLRSRNDLLADGAGSWAYFEALEQNCTRLMYDSIGVGAGAAASLRGKTTISVAGWNASGSVVNPRGQFASGRSNEDMFANAKSQAWWGLRTRFMRTYQLVSEGRVGIAHDEIISIDPKLPELRELKSELSQVTYAHNNAGKVLINKQPDGHISPNRADSVMIAFAPVAPAAGVIGVF